MKDCFQVRLALIIGAWLVVAVPGTASANDGMAPSVFEMIQADQDVKIVLKMADSGEPGLNDAFRLERNGDDGTVTVLDDHTFIPDDAVYIGEPGCRWWDSTTPSEYCRYYTPCVGCDDDDYYDPAAVEACNDCDNDGYNDCWGDCVESSETGEMECRENYCGDEGSNCNRDCDHDGVNDCDGWCQTVYRFEIVDACVPPGQYHYEFYYLYNDTWQDLSWMAGPDSLEVTDSGQECAVSPEENDSDSDDNDEDDSDSGNNDNGSDDSDAKDGGADDDRFEHSDGDDDSTCSVSAVGANSRTSLFYLLSLL